MLEAYADASSSSLDKSRVVDAKKVAAARSKLQNMFNPARDLKGLPYCDSASLSTSPNTVTHPLSVSHSGSAHSLTEGAPEGVPSLPYASSSAAFDQLYKSGRDDDDVDMNDLTMDQSKHENVTAPTDLKPSKRKFESESSDIGHVPTSSKRVHADASPPPPPPSESPVIASSSSSAALSLQKSSYATIMTGQHSDISTQGATSLTQAHGSSLSIVDEKDDLPPPPPPDDFPVHASTPLIST